MCDAPEILCDATLGFLWGRGLFCVHQLNSCDERTHSYVDGLVSFAAQ
jgi:hypothetical protein